MQINIIDLVPIELRRKVITLRSSHLTQRAEGIYQMYQDLMYHESQDWIWPTGALKDMIQRWLAQSEFRQFSYHKHEVVIAFIDQLLSYIQEEDLKNNELEQLKSHCENGLGQKRGQIGSMQKDKFNLEQGRFNIFANQDDFQKTLEKLLNHQKLKYPSSNQAMNHPGNLLNVKRNKTDEKQLNLLLQKLDTDISKLETEINQYQQKIKEIDENLKKLYQKILQNIHQNWNPQVKLWKKIKGAFEFLQEFLGIPSFDLARSILQHRNAWFEIQKLEKLLIQCEEIHKIAESLGRLKETEESESSFDEIFEPIKRNKELLKEISDAIPESFDGVELSSSISRMLASESILLLRPALKKLFHIKRIEEKLNTYRPEGTRLEKELIEEDQAEKTKKKKPKKGPIILCLDTSGSMMGSPEYVAKAISLVLLKISYAEKRPYMIYNFSGPNDFVKKEYLPTDPNHMAIEVLNLIGQSFCGGTEVERPLKAAMHDITTKDWEKADVLMVSDGGFDVSEEFVQEINLCHQKFGTRFHGLLIGYYDAVMKKICNPLHHFNDW